MTIAAGGYSPPLDRRKILEWLADESISGRYLPQDVITILLHACAHPSLRGDALKNAWADLERTVGVREYVARECPGDASQKLYEDRARQALTLLTDGQGHDSKPLIEETARELGVGYLLDSRLPVPDRDVAQQAPGPPV